MFSASSFLFHRFKIDARPLKDVNDNALHYVHTRAYTLYFFVSACHSIKMHGMILVCRGIIVRTRPCCFPRKVSLTRPLARQSFLSRPRNVTSIVSEIISFPFALSGVQSRRDRRVLAERLLEARLPSGSGDPVYRFGGVHQTGATPPRVKADGEDTKLKIEREEEMKKSLPSARAATEDSIGPLKIHKFPRFRLPTSRRHELQGNCTE